MPGGCKGQAGNTSGRALSAPQQELRWSPLTRSLHGASGASQHGTLPRFPALLLLFPELQQSQKMRRAERERWNRLPGSGGSSQSGKGRKRQWVGAHSHQVRSTVSPQALQERWQSRSRPERCGREQFLYPLIYPESLKSNRAAHRNLAGRPC